MTLANSQLRALLVTALATIAFPAMADVDMYVEYGGGRVYLAGRCTKDWGVHWCTCALADETASPAVEDASMCWKIEGDRIIFTGDKLKFEMRLDELKIDTTDRVPRVPVSGAVEASS